MNKLTLLLVGLAAGWLAEQIVGRDQTLIMSLVLGIAVLSLEAFLATQVLDVRYSEGLNPATIAITQAGPYYCWWSRKGSTGQVDSEAAFRAASRWS